MPQFVNGKAHRALQRVAANRPMAHQLRLREAHLLQVGVKGYAALPSLPSTASWTARAEVTL